MPTVDRELVYTGDITDVSLLTVRALHHVGDASFGRGAKKLTIHIEGRAIAAFESICTKTGGIEPLIKQKDIEYIQANILEGYLRLLLPDVNVRVSLASITEDILLGIDAFCEIGNLTYAVDFTSGNGISEKLIKGKNRDVLSGIKDRLVVFNSWDSIQYFFDVIHYNMDMIRDPDLMQNIFDAFIEQGEFPSCEIYSVDSMEPISFPQKLLK